MTAQNLKIVHVVTKSIVCVGRGLDNDIRITDISVSRDHAHLRWNKDGSIWILDLVSKFGSAVQVQKPLLLQNQVLQIGRTLVRAKIFQHYGFLDWICCLKKNNFTEAGGKEDYPVEFDERYDLVNETQRELEFIKEKLDKH